MNMSVNKKTPKDRLQGRKTLAVTNFLDEFEKDDIKRFVDIVELFSHFGVGLTKKGKNYVAKCPWHSDDKTPSLSVDREKGLYNCFGCGEGGDIFTLTGKMKGLDFKESLKYLKGFRGSAEGQKTKAESSDSSYGDISPAEPEALTPGSVEPETPGPESSTGREPDKDETGPASFSAGTTLTAAAGHYHRKLFENENALEYLKSRGLTDPAIYSRFMIGYSDGTLLSMIGEEQKKELVEAGILRRLSPSSNNRQGGEVEHFKNCVTFPVLDESNRVVGVYGRASTPLSTGASASLGNRPEHLYLKGRHRGVFNRKASRVYDEIILTESIIDALSLVQLGIENVQALYGTNGFTDEHLAILKHDRVKTVISGLDNDEPGRAAAVKLKEKLLTEGFKVKEIYPPLLPAVGLAGDLRQQENPETSELSDAGNCIEPKDWNEYLVKGLTVLSAEELAGRVKEIIKNTEESYPAEDKSSLSFKVVEDEMSTTFAVNGISYRVTGMKELFAGSLRVNIKAEKPPLPVGHLPLEEGERLRETGEVKYYDNLDLYSARSRASFAANLAKAFMLEPVRVERDLVAILEYLEERRDRKLKGEENAQPEMTAEERELGLSLLEDETLFDRIVHDMELLGYAGENLNKQLIYLAASSRKLDNPISVLIVSGSAAGKSFIVDTVKELLPPEEVLIFTSLSDQALNYAEELNHKFLSLGEAVHSEPVEHQIREIISGKMISRFVTTKDPKTGKLKSTLVSSPAAVSMVITGTRYDINPENASRFFVVNVDESREQTRRIHELQRKSFRVENIHRKKHLLPEIIKTHRAAQRLLRPLATVIPYAEHIDFPDTLMRTRRDQARFLDLISCVSYLRQFQKEIKFDSENSIEYLEADLKDYEIAREILVKGVLASTMRELPRSAIDLYEMIRKMAKRFSKREDLTSVDVSFTQRDIREHTGFGHTWVKQNLRTLVDYEYLLVITGGSARTKGRYRLRADEEIKDSDFSMIPSSDELKKRINGTVSLDFHGFEAENIQNI